MCARCAGVPTVIVIITCAPRLPTLTCVHSALGYPLASEIARPLSSWIRKHPLTSKFDSKFEVLAVNMVAGAAGGVATMPFTLPLYISTVLTQVDCRRPRSAVPNVGGFTNAVGFASNPGGWWYYLTRVTPLYGCGESYRLILSPASSSDPIACVV